MMVDLIGSIRLELIQVPLDVPTAGAIAVRAGEAKTTTTMTMTAV